MAVGDGQIRQADDGANPYDVVPYESHCFDFTQPDRLHAIGRLFGLTPPDFRVARVLELGCAGGGNLAPLAARYPDAHFIGVDLSEVEIGHARELAAEMGAKNIEFRQMSITDITPEFGVFDFIIVHGVFSWVPAPVRAAIVRVAKENLSPNGVALISYNTLPGWNQVRAVRDMMLYHCSRFATLEEKVAQGIALLRFVLESADKGLVAYRESIQSELNLLTTQRAYYIFHEHLENENFSLHLHEMASMIRAQGLEYLADSHLEIMYLQNFPEKVAQALGAENDIVRIEQYLDFITNRRFRISLFCHGDSKLQRNIDGSSVLEFYLGSKILPLTNQVDITHDGETQFKLENGLSLTTHNRYAASLVSILSVMGNRIVSAREILAKAVAKCAGAPGEGKGEQEVENLVRGAFVDLGLRLVFSGGLTLHSAAPNYATTVSLKPTAFSAARAISKRSDVVPSVFHTRMSLGLADRFLLRACDGSRDRKGLIAFMENRLKSGELSMQRNGQAVGDLSLVRADLEAWTDDMLRQFAGLGLLTA